MVASDDRATFFWDVLDSSDPWAEEDLKQRSNQDPFEDPIKHSLTFRRFRINYMALWHAGNMTELPATDSVSSPISLRGESSAAVVMLHGFTGSPYVWRDIAHRVHASTDASVSVPLLPGHGTVWTDMLDYTWEDWVECALETVDAALENHDRVVVAGLSMGGTLALETLISRPEVAAGVLVNPAVFVDSPFARFAGVLSPFVTDVKSIGGDIARPGMDEYAYPRTPLSGVAELYRGCERVRTGLWSVETPVTLMSSSTDNVVASRSSDFIEREAQNVTRVILRHSFHVATLDYDAPGIVQQIERALTVEEA